MAERLEIRSLLLAARVALRVGTLVDAWEAVCQLPVCGEELASPWVSGVRVEQEATRLLGADSCLPQALAAAALFRRHGHRGALVLGVARDGATLGAHAWFELHGIPVVGGAQRPRFRSIWRGELP